MIQLQPFSQADFEQLIRWIPDAAFALQWGGPAFTYPLTEEQLEHYIKDANTPQSSAYIFKAVDTASNEVVGHISIGSVDRVNNCARIGKVLIGASNHRGKGYGTQLMEAALVFAFEQLRLHKVSLGVFDFNTAAITCYEKVGFQQEGLLRDARKHGNEYWNLIEMGMLEHEWQARR